MEFNYAYKGNTGVIEQGNNTQMSFSPDLKRPPTYFIGELRQNVAFREAISALHDVVVSDMRFQPKDKTAYKEWRAKQEEIGWKLVALQRQETTNRIKEIQTELNTSGGDKRPQSLIYQGAGAKAPAEKLSAS